MKRKISLSTTLTLIILTAALTVSVTMLLAMRYFNNQVQSVSQRQAMYTHINDVDKKVREYYEDIDEETLRQAITQGYVDGIGDQYAAYYDPAEYVQEQLRLAGKANNVGVDVCYNADDQITVCKVHADSAADKAGVQVGDVITALDGESIESKRLSEAQKAISTAAKVMLSVQRGDAPLAFELSAYEYTVRSVEDTMLDGDIGYVRISAFYENTPEQFRSTVSALQDKGAGGLIFDLRNNAGGSRAAAEEVISYLMPLGMYGTVIDRNGTQTMLSASANSQIGVSSVTLVNAGTAGEAEFFAGVLQEFSLTTVVGQTTAGKAAYQEYFPLEADNSAVKLTVGEYGLLKGGSWQDTGIHPDRQVVLPAEQEAIYQLVKPAEDAQVKAALMLINQSGSSVPSATQATVILGTTTAATTAGTTTTTNK